MKTCQLKCKLVCQQKCLHRQKGKKHWWLPHKMKHSMKSLHSLVQVHSKHVTQNISISFTLCLFSLYNSLMVTYREISALNQKLQISNQLEKRRRRRKKTFSCLGNLLPDEVWDVNLCYPLVSLVSLDVRLLLPGEDKGSSSHMKLLKTLSVAHQREKRSLVSLYS